MALNIYNTFYANQNSRGVGQAEGVIFFVIVVIIAALLLKEFISTMKTGAT